MSTFDNKSFKNVTLKSITTRQFSTSEYFSLDSYLTIPSSHNDTTSDHFINTIHEVYVPSI